MTTQAKITLASLAFVLFSIIVLGLSWLLAAGETASLTLSYAAGLSMIFLPCTLPLVFVIVPLTLGRTPGKGLSMALLFALGLTITLALYGIFTSQIGAYLGLDRATQIMFVIAGTAALAFGLSELKLAGVPIPGFHTAIPSFLQRRQDYAKAFGLGLFLGNAGVGCPNPAFYVLLGYIATVGSAATGAVIGAVHGIGRATPLLLFAVLGILGVNTIGWVQKQAQKINTWMGWALVFVGAFILTYGLFGMHWWEDSIFHASWNRFIFERVPALAELPDHPVAPGAFQGPMAWGWASLILLSGIPLIWYHLRYKLSKTAIVLAIVVYGVLGGLLATGNIKAEDAHGGGVENESNHSQ